MKKVIFIWMAFLPLLVFGQKAKIDFQVTSYNFGTIGEKDGKVSYDFKFRNTGNSPLILTNVRAGCGCTSPSWNWKPIAPGGEGSIKVTFDPRNRPGSFVKGITVNSNAENAVVSLTIRGKVSRKSISPYSNYPFVIGKVRATTDLLNLGTVQNTQKVSKTIEVINTDKEPATLSVNTQAPYMTVNVTPATLQKDEKGKIEIRYDAGQVKDWGLINSSLSVNVNKQEEQEIKIIANVTEDFSSYQGNFDSAPRVKLSETQAELKDLNPNTNYTHDFYIQNEGKSELVIRKIKTSDSDFSVHLAKQTIKPGKKVKASVSFKTNLPQSTKIIQLITNDPQNPVVVFKLTASAR